jgi:hypothetical protein
MALQTIGPNDINTAYDFTINGLTVGKGGGSDSGSTTVGYLSLGAGSTNTGTNNTSVGYGSMYVNTSGGLNAAFGQGTLRFNTTGGNNVAVGMQALNQNTTASNNTAVGYQAGYTGTTSSYNTFFGAYAGYTSNPSTTTVGNTCLGFFSGYALTTGIGNTFVGGNNSVASGQLITTGSKNTILGCFTGNASGLDIRTASNYIVLSDGDGNPRGWFDSNGTWIVGGSTATVYSKTIIKNNAALLTCWNNGGTSGYFDLVYFFNNAGSTSVGSIQRVNDSTTSYLTSSDYRLKDNITPMTNALDKVSKLKPVTYKWKTDGSNGEGFIAHELQEICPIAVSGEKDAVNEDGSIKAQSIDTSHLVATLTAAIQELSAQVTTLQAQVTAQAARITVLEAK